MKSEAVEYLFSYGTLQKEKVQLETFGRKFHGSPDVLQGYRLDTVEITDEAVLSTSEEFTHLIAVPTGSNSDRIEGVILELTPEELKAADDYEVDDYKRISETFESGRKAWIYVAVTGMNYEFYKNSLNNASPPEDLSVQLEALWHDAKGDWKSAHDLIDQLNDKQSAHVHAYLHRKEGDIWNADYWYTRAGKKRPQVSLDQEWEQIVKSII